MRTVCIPWSLFSIGYYAANALWQGYMSLYYGDLGFDHGQIGLISALMAVCALGVQPLWGRICDASNHKNRLLALLASLSALILPLSLLGKGLMLQLVCAGLFYSFYCALLPMGDAILLEGLREGKLPFGPYRLLGAMSFALSGAAFGWLLQRFSPRLIPLAGAVMLALTAAFALRLPPGGKRTRKITAFSALFRDKNLMTLLILMILPQSCMGYFYTFFAPHFSALEGGSAALLGLGYALATLSEIPYLILSDKIFSRFGAALPMAVATLIMSIRWLLLGVGRTAIAALISQLLHGGGFIVMTVSMAKYIAAHVPESLRASGQMLLSMVAFGVARVSGNLGGGYLAEKWGSDRVFLLCAALCLLSGIILLRQRAKLSNYCSSNAG